MFLYIKPQVLSIQNDSLIVNATDLRASCCNCTTTASLTLDAAQPYAFSGENKFFVNGCNFRGFFSSDKSTGMKCETGCDNPDPITDNYCNGFGCCSSPVPSGSRGNSLANQLTRWVIRSLAVDKLFYNTL